jgi:Amt family ammonium transporter
LVTALLGFHFGAASQDLAGAPLTGASAATAVVATAAASPASAPVAAPNHPALAAQSQINAADTAWMLTSTALVLLMTLPGIALFYGGMIRRKNVINTLASVAAIAALGVWAPEVFQQAQL